MLSFRCILCDFDISSHALHERKNMLWRKRRLTPDKAMHKDPRRYDCFRVQHAGLSNLIDFCNGDIRRRRERRIEVARGATVHKIAMCIGSMGTNKGKISTQGSLHYVLTAIEDALFLPFFYHG